MIRLFRDLPLRRRAAHAAVRRRSDAGVQIEQAIEESKRQRGLLVQQAAAVIGNQRELELRLGRSLDRVDDLPLVGARGAATRRRSAGRGRRRPGGRVRVDGRIVRGRARHRRGRAARPEGAPRPRRPRRRRREGGRRDERDRVASAADRAEEALVAARADQDAGADERCARDPGRPRPTPISRRWSRCTTGRASLRGGDRDGRVAGHRRGRRAPGAEGEPRRPGGARAQRGAGDAQSRGAAT